MPDGFGRALSFYAQRENDAQGMKAGPRYDADTHEIVVPSYVYFPKTTPAANAIWKAKGLRYHAEDQEWRVHVPAAHAQEQLQKARALYFRVHGMTEEVEHV